MSKLKADDPVAVAFNAARGRRLQGKRDLTPTVDDLHEFVLEDHPRTVKAQKRTEKNKRRRASNWKGN